MGTDGMGAREAYREIVLENIDHDYLSQQPKMDRERLDEIAELIVDTVCSNRQTIRIAGDDYPAEVVKARFLKLDSGHVQYVMDCMAENTTYVRNIKKYLLAALYNAPTTISSYYSSLVQHDMYGTDWGPRKVGDFVGKGGATERESFSPSGGNERYGVCDDAKGGGIKCRRK
jgi:hypothetical protein